jgi:kumamolisin
VASTKKPSALAPVRKVNPNKKVTFSVFAPTRTKALEAYVKVQQQRIASGDLFGGRITSKSEFTRRFGATKGAMKKAQAEVQKWNIEVLSSHPHTGEHICRGRVGDIQKMIPNLNLKVVKVGDIEYHSRAGAHDVNAPAGTFDKILGLDTTPLCKSHLVRLPESKRGLLAAAPNANAGPFTPFDLKPIFNVPTGTDGTGQTIGIIALDGGFNVKDAVDYARNVLKIKGTVTVKVRKIDGASGKPQPQGADIETVLDVDGSLGAPGATIWVVIAMNTDASFAHGLDTLIDLGCDIITISWGSAEANWTDQGRAAMHQVFARAFAAGVTVYAAAGDNLSPDSVEDGKVHADYPSADELVISMIGLWLSKDGKIIKVWNSNGSGSGGGVADGAEQQDWEKVGPNVASLNDGVVRHWCGGLAGPGDPETGLVVMYSGTKEQVGGTSADGPIYAGITACANQALSTATGGKKKRVGFYLPWLLKTIQTDKTLVTPVLDGDNAPEGGKGYTGPELTMGLLNVGRFVELLAAA